MRVFLKWVGRGLAVSLVLVLALGLWKREEISRLLAVNSLFEPDRIVANFSNMEGAFLTAPLPEPDGDPSPLPQGPAAKLPPTVRDWITERNVTSFLILKDGAIVHEAYFQGTGPEDRRISWSVAKSYLSALLGIVIAEGQIESLDDPVTRYVPALAGSAYDGARLRDVVNMASGVVFDEDYLDYNSDINRMGRVLALGGRMDDFTADLSETFTDPGSEWQYVSIDTHVIGMVIRGATGRDIPDLLAEKIITPLGLERAPYYITDGDGVAFVLGGLNVTTRDYARFGQMIAQGGTWQGKTIVPADWIDASTVPSAPTAPGKIQYGYQWWIPADAREGEVYAHGIYGQYIYMDRRQNVVIIATSADRKFRESGVRDANIDLFRGIVDGLR